MTRAAERGLPRTIVVDDGPEFAGRARAAAITENWVARVCQGKKAGKARSNAFRLAALRAVAVLLEPGVAGIA